MKDERLYIRISAEQKRDLEATAVYNGVTISQIVISALINQDYIRKEAPEDGETE